MKRIVIVPLAAALAALTTSTSQSQAATSATSEPGVDESPATQCEADVQPNAFFSAGDDLLGLIVTKAADGTVLAQHYSHMSHSSHSSHQSHYSHYSSGY